MTRIVDHLRQQAGQRFVGREAELSLFRQALASSPPPFSAILIHGPGGVGKTALLERMRALAAETGMDSLRLDARDLESPTSAGVTSGLAAALGLHGPKASLAEVIDLWSKQPRRLLIIDTFELLSHLDNWFRNAVMSEMPQETLVVLAGRNPPGPQWLTDPLWREGVRIIALRNLAPDDCDRFLAARGLPPEQREASLNMTYGHPLALTLLTDFVEANGTVPERLDTDLIRLLTDCFAAQAPTPLHRDALEICAHARATTQDLLAEMVDEGQSHALFDWLAGLSFVESGPRGLFPHDLVRDAMTAELRWRHPERRLALGSRLRDYYLKRLHTQPLAARNGATMDILFLQRDNEVMQRFVDFSRVGSLSFGTALVDEREAILSLMRARGLAEHTDVWLRWCDHPAARTWVARDGALCVVGLVLGLEISSLSATEIASDGAVAEASQWIAEHMPARPGERVQCARMFVSAGSWAALDPVLNTLQMCMVQHWLTEPQLGIFVAMIGNADHWAPMMTHVDFRRIEVKEDLLDGVLLGQFIHDWRATPPDRWMALMTANGLGVPTDGSPAVQAPRTTPVVVLSQGLFEQAVRDALRHWADLAAFSGNPLLKSRLVQSAALGDEAPTATLRRLLQESAAQLQAHPKSIKFFKALELTYFRPAGSQELAAERLGLPFGTYRYQLNMGVERIMQHLWQHELLQAG